MFLQGRLLLSFLFVFVGPVERCDLENFSNPWRAVVVGVQTFRKKKIEEKF
jgi:hypothetical protein